MEGDVLPRKVFTRHDPASHARYQDLKQLARAQERVLPGTPGTVKKRSRRGTEYWVREYIRADGRKDDEHIGTVNSVDAARIKQMQAAVELAKALASGSSTLRVFGYQRVERKAAAVLGALFNRQLFDAGLVLVGSHAYGILLNEYGIIAAGYRTQDIDVARAQPLAVALPAGLDFLQLLKESGLQFAAVPGMPSHKPSFSFKLPGAEALAVDLLVPGEEHAQTIPLLRFLIEEPARAVALGANHVVPVSVPSAERFVLHKLYSSQSRRSDREKIRKDLEQAAVLTAVLEEDTPGTLKDALRRLPAEGRPAVKRGARAAARLLSDAQPQAAEVLDQIAGKQPPRRGRSPRS